MSKLSIYLAEDQLQL